MGAIHTCVQESSISPQNYSGAETDRSSDELRYKQSCRTRLKYVLPFIVWSITIYALLNYQSKEHLESIPYLCSDILGHNLCSELTSFEGSYRMYSITAVYHLILGIVLVEFCCTTSTKDSLQNDLWMFKILGFTLLAVGAFFIPQKSSLVIWISYVALVGAFLFLLFQFFLLIDLLGTFVEFWVNASEDYKSKQKPLYYIYSCIMVCISFAFLALTVLLVCIIFLFTSRAKCKWNDIFTVLILCQCFVAFALSFHPKVRSIFRLEVFMLPSTFIALYTVLLLLLAVTSQQDTECNLAKALHGYDLPIGPNTRSVFAALVAFIALTYASFKVPSNTYITRLLKIGNTEEPMTNLEDAVKICEIEENKRELYHHWQNKQPLNEVKTTTTYTFEEKIPRDYNYSCFHLFLSCASLYLLLSVTNWYGPVGSDSKSSSKSAVVGIMPAWKAAELTLRIASFGCVLSYIILMLFVITRTEKNEIKNKDETPNNLIGISFGEAIRNLNVSNPDYRSPSPDIRLDTSGKMNLSCHKVNNLKVLYWHFPKTISQSYYGGRNGSNACTIIAMLIARTFYQSELVAPLPNALPNEWIRVFVNCISEGNKLYDSLVNTKGEGAITLAVEDVAENFGKDFEVSNVFCPLPVTFKSDIETETLVFQISKHKADNKKQCLIFIKDFRTGVFLIQRDGTLLFADSHPYGSGGAILVCEPSGSAYHLCKFLQAVLLSRIDTLGTITSVKFTDRET